MVLYFSTLNCLDVCHLSKSDDLKYDDDENIILRKTALSKNNSTGIPFSKEIKIKRVREGNCERRSMATLVSTEFNKHHRILLTASVDGTMAFFKVRNFRFKQHLYLKIVFFL